jgi:uncharacterized membrane protein YccC
MAGINRLLYLIFVVLAVFVVQRAISGLQHEGLIWAAFILPLAIIDGTLNQRFLISFITGSLLVIIVFITGFFAATTGLLIGVVLLILALCTYVGQVYTRYSTAALIISIFTILSSSIWIPSADNTQRFFAMSVGVGIVVILQILYGPYTLTQQWYLQWIAYLRTLRNLNDEIFSCFLQPEYPDNIYLFERRLHVRKMECLQTLTKMRKTIQQAQRCNKQNQAASWQPILQQLEILFSNVLDYAQLRRRVTDFATFSICSQELSQIFQALTQIFKDAETVKGRHTIEMDVNILRQYIHRLEENYHHVLQIASREPLPFLLFINSLNLFCDNLEGLSHHAA